jgi:serine/threonine-protein kinase
MEPGVVSSVLNYFFARGDAPSPVRALGAPASPMRKSPPPTLGRYEIREKIGSGSFGTVFRAYDPVLSREVAVKTCEADEPTVRARFEREARMAAGLHHPRIVTIHDFCDEEGTLFLVQEFLGGEDLDRVIERREPLPPSEKLEILRDIAEGMAHAHSRGVIHRDIKPANIRRLEDGRAKILDFGIARRMGSENLTKPGLTVGSVAYMSPEQLRGEPVDSRTDVFSFGAVAFELLTYRRAFPGERLSDVFHAIEKSDPEPVTELCPELSDSVAGLVCRCLAKDREERFSSGEELQAALAAVESDGGTLFA